MNKKVNKSSLQLLVYLVEGTIKQIEELRLRLAWLPREVALTTEKLEERLCILRRLLSGGGNQHAGDFFVNQIRPLWQEAMRFLNSRKYLEALIRDELGTCPRCGEPTREDLVEITHALALCTCLETDSTMQSKLSDLRSNLGFDEIVLARIFVEEGQLPFLKIEARWRNESNRDGIWQMYLVLCHPMVVLTKDSEFEAIANSEIF